MHHPQRVVDAVREVLVRVPASHCAAVNKRPGRTERRVVNKTMNCPKGVAAERRVVAGAASEEWSVNGQAKQSGRRRVFKASEE